MDAADVARHEITLLFDGACPLCRREMSMLKRRDRSDRLGSVDISDPSFDPKTFGLSKQDVHSRIHGILADGQIVEGVEVFRRAYRAVGIGWLLGWTRWPILKPIVDAFYRWFARNRHRLTFRRNPCEGDHCSIA
jgi:predicted DCC family thiol-disulfide oxidoreductase YuxK